MPGNSISFLFDLDVLRNTAHGGCEAECRLSWTGGYPFVDGLEFGDGFENQVGVAQVGQEFVRVMFQDLFV